MRPDVQPAKPVPTPWEDALLAIELLTHSINNANFKPLGICVKSSPGPVLDRWLERLTDFLPERALIKLPPRVDLDRLVGGINLTATLAARSKVEEPGLFAKADGNILLLSNPGSFEPDIIGNLLLAIDQGEVVVERDGISARHQASFACVVIHDEEEELSDALSDRLALHIDLTGVDIRQIDQNCPPTKNIVDEDVGFESPKPEAVRSIVELALGFGIHSLRPALQASQILALYKALNSSGEQDEEALLVAMRLSLVPRSTVLPTSEEMDFPEEQEAQSQEQPDEESENKTSESDIGELEELSIDAVLASLPEGLLDDLSRHKKPGPGSSVTGRTGQGKHNFKRGRPVASMRGSLCGNKRLDILATLRASAPWQKIRRSSMPDQRSGALQIRSSDFYVRRFKKPAESTSIFVVDASGSTAINRLAEAKGAIELVLTESYARRDYVALIALKGRSAELILPPTRSLVMAKRTLSGLTGGGGTPLADGLRQGLNLANDEQRKGRKPTLIVLTDGSANIDLNGQSGRQQAQADAMEIAGHIAISNHAVIVIDVSKLVGKQAREVAQACHSQYVAMPFANASSISDAVNMHQSAGVSSGIGT